MEKDEEVQSDPKGGVQVVSRTAAIMRALSAHPGGLSLTAIANEVGLPRSTVQRLVTALEIEGLVDGKGPSGGTRLGPTVSSLLATAHADMVVFGRHQLKMLLDALGETSSIITAVNAKGMVLETMTAEHALRVVLCQGSQVPLYASAGGKALLSAYDDSLIERVFGPELEALTPWTLTNRKALQSEVAQARERGIAIARNEQAAGISSFATVVDTSMGIYAFEVTLPDARFDARATDIESAMLAHRETVMADAFGFEKDRQAGALGLPSAAAT